MQWHSKKILLSAALLALEAYRIFRFCCIKGKHLQQKQAKAPLAEFSCKDTNVVLSTSPSQTHGTVLQHPGHLPSGRCGFCHITVWLCHQGRKGVGVADMGDSCHGVRSDLNELCELT